MNNHLRVAVTVLVLLNLVFVQLTDAVGMQWLLPMQIATAASPLFVRLQEYATWRAGWNLGVIAIFGVLVRDTMTTGPRHMLEDGLILAAFCQVHLLNVLRRQQNSDLLFFNSFLIALVTSFFCQDLAFSLTFIAYAFVFVATLELAADRGRRPALRVVRASTRRASLVVAVTAAVFALVPRDFSREGLVDEHSLSGLVKSSSSGFNDEIDLTRPTLATVSDRVVMLVRPIDGDPSAVPSHWRGAALDWYDARGWRSIRRARNEDATSTPWHALGYGHFDREGTPRSRVIVESEDPNATCLFVPLEAIEVGVPVDATPESVYPRADGTIVRRLPVDVRPAPFSYSVAIGDAGRSVGEATGTVLRPFLNIDTTRPEVVPPVVHALVLDALRGLPEDASQTQLVERCRAFLAGRFDYVLPGRPGSASDMAAFLAGEGGGHCEMFATGLALMLRLRGVPCRVATGYLVDEWDEAQRAFVVRQRHAHAWVEVYDRDRQGWEAVDPTPAHAGDSAAATSWTESLAAPLRDFWLGVTTFDAKRRGALLDDLLGSPKAVLRAAKQHPLEAIVILALAAFGVATALRRHRRRRADPVRAYERSLRRTPLRRESHETPREFLERARRTPGLRPADLAELERATHAHESARFVPGARHATRNAVTS